MLDTTRSEPLRSPLLDRERENGVKHGFFTRTGGVSTGLYEGLNVGYGSGDDRETVTKNRKRVAEWLGVETDCLLTAHQVHSPHAIIVDEPFAGDRPEADALVTNQPGLALGALAADCGPILFSDGRARVIAAAHAGWKGALTGILENTIAAMELLGAERETITAVLGPSISQENYEVGPEFIERFVNHNPANGDWFRSSEKAGHAFFDLNGYTVARLTAAGVNAAQMGRCTYDDEEHFYSYRRATHRGERDYGRQISAIALEDI